MGEPGTIVSRARADAARQGVHIEQLTLGWMLVEAVVSLGAGIAAHSLLLVAFGLDSGIELVSGGILLWRLQLQARHLPLDQVDQAERRAAWVVAVALSALCLYIVVSAAASLLTRQPAESSLPGLVIAALAVIGMPLLAWRKRHLAKLLDSAALKGDAACSLTCAYMAGTLFLGLLLSGLFRWWWAEGLIALVFLWFLIPEAREAWEGAQRGTVACACGDEDCLD
ncbi:MAG: cation transporter [Ktedonobacterales bacterium]